ncbi:MAG: hypothetical protein RID81_07035 [Sandaracinaceae bacterium]
MSDLITSLRRTRNDHAKEYEWHRFLWDAYTGGGGFEGAVKQPESGYWGPAAEAYSTGAASLGLSHDDSYLDRHPREDDRKLQSRRNVAHYWNFVEPVVGLKLSFLLQRPFTVENLPEEIAEWAEDADGNGHSLEDIVRDVIAVQSAVLGWTPAIIDLPRAPGELTRAQARENGIRPYVTPSTPVALLDWHKGRGGRLEWAKVRTVYSEQASPLDAPVEIEEITFWYPDRAEVYQIRKVGGAETVAGPEVYSHPFGEVPVLVSRRKPVPLDPVRGMPWDKQVAVECRRLFNAISELDEHMRGQVFAILQVPTSDPTKLGKITLGVDNAVPIDPDARQSWAYIAPPASVAETYETRIERTIREIYRMARVEWDRSTGGVESGEARKKKFAATNATIVEAARELARWQEAVYRLAGRGLGVSEERLAQIRVIPPTDFDVEELTTKIRNALDALSARLGPTASSLIRKRLASALLPDATSEDREQIDLEIEGIAKMEETEAQFDAEISRAQNGSEGLEGGDGDGEDGEEGGDDDGGE